MIAMQLAKGLVDQELYNELKDGNVTINIAGFNFKPPKQLWEALFVKDEELDVGDGPKKGGFGVSSQFALMVAKNIKLKVVETELILHD